MTSTCLCYLLLSFHVNDVILALHKLYSKRYTTDYLQKSRLLIEQFSELVIISHYIINNTLTCHNILPACWYSRTQPAIAIIQITIAYIVNRYADITVYLRTFTLYERSARNIQNVTKAAKGQIIVRASKNFKILGRLVSIVSGSGYGFNSSYFGSV